LALVAIAFAQVPTIGIILSTQKPARIHRSSLVSFLPRTPGTPARVSPFIATARSYPGMNQRPISLNSLAVPFTHSFVNPSYAACHAPTIINAPKTHLPTFVLTARVSIESFHFLIHVAHPAFGKMGTFNCLITSSLLSSGNAVPTSRITSSIRGLNLVILSFTAPIFIFASFVNWSAVAIFGSVSSALVISPACLWRLSTWEYISPIRSRAFSIFSFCFSLIQVGNSAHWSNKDSLVLLVFSISIACLRAVVSVPDNTFLSGYLGSISARIFWRTFSALPCLIGSGSDSIISRSRFISSRSDNLESFACTSICLVSSFIFLSFCVVSFFSSASFPSDRRDFFSFNQSRCCVVLMLSILSLIRSSLAISLSSFSISNQRATLLVTFRSSNCWYSDVYLDWYSESNQTGIPALHGTLLCVFIVLARVCISTRDKPVPFFIFSIDDSIFLILWSTGDVCLSITLIPCSNDFSHRSHLFRSDSIWLVSLRMAFHSFVTFAFSEWNSGVLPTRLNLLYWSVAHAYSLSNFSSTFWSGVVFAASISTWERREDALIRAFLVSI